MNQEVYDLIILIQDKVKPFQYHDIIFKDYRLCIWKDDCNIGKKNTGLRMSISRRDLSNRFENEELEQFKFCLEEELLKLI
jgi:hypothetical protein